MAGSPGLDRFTRTYLVVLTIIAVAGIAWWLSTWDSRLSQMNEILASDAELAGYPYQFKVISLENGVDSIRWTIDRKWYAANGVYLD